MRVLPEVRHRSQGRRLSLSAPSRNAWPHEETMSPPRGPQVIFALPPTGDTDYSMRLWNSDGSEPEMCGNGIRCLARFVAERDGDGAGTTHRIHTLAGAGTSATPGPLAYLHAQETVPGLRACEASGHMCKAWIGNQAKLSQHAERQQGRAALGCSPQHCGGQIALCRVLGSLHNRWGCKACTENKRQCPRTSPQQRAEQQQHNPGPRRPPGHCWWR